MTVADYETYFNGDWVPWSHVKIDPTDRGFTSADVVFDVARTFNGKSFRMKEHVDRLYRSLQYTRIDPGLSNQEMLDISEEVITRNEHLRADVGDYWIHQVITRGRGRFAGIATDPTVFVHVSPVDFARNARFYKEGAHAVIAKTRSYPVESLDSKIKHYSRMNFNLAELEAYDVDPDAWPLLLDSDGNLTEGTSNNIFVVTDGVIRTPGDSSILQGVSRGALFDLARQLNIPVSEEELQPYDLYTADEAFFSASSACLLPVTKVDNRQVADGKPGPITEQLLAAWSEWVGLDIVDQSVRFSNE